MFIVYVEDESHLRQQITRFLEHFQHRVVSFPGALPALDFLRLTEPDLLLCDFLLEGGPNGLSLAEQVRNLYPACPIVMVSQYMEKEDLAHAIQVGVDGYVSRPVSLEDLHQHLWDTLERRRRLFPRTQTEIHSGALRLHIPARQATWHGQPLHLTPTEFALLHQLLKVPGQVIRTEDLCAAVKGIRADYEQAGDWLKPHLRRLRQKLERKGQPSPIRNVHGVGYLWEG